MQQHLRHARQHSGTDNLESLQAAAAAGSGAAQKRLGERYFFGEGVERDFRQAAAWLNRAASGDEPGARELLRRVDAMVLGARKLLQQHLQEAVRRSSPTDLQFLCLAVAERVDACTMMHIESYFSDKGVERGNQKAADWLSRAALRGVPGAQQLLQQYLHHATQAMGTCGSEFLQTAAVAGVAEAQDVLDRQTADWLSRAASRSVRSEEKLLRQFLHHALQTKSTYGLEFLQAAAAEGVVGAQDLLEYLNWKKDPQRDYRQAAKWLGSTAKRVGSGIGELLRQQLRRAAESSDPHDLEFVRGAAEEGVGEAQRLLGEKYLSGKGTPRDCRQAGKWLGRAAKHKGSGAEGLMRKHLRRAEQRSGPAELDFLHGAATEGVGKAQKLLGEKYLSGKGTPRDYRQAVKWLKLAASCNEPGANALLDMATFGIAPPTGPRPAKERFVNALANPHTWNHHDWTDW